ncbi:ATPase family AAA domain-containing protein 1-B [Thelohanellus kitauei]|uniref:ATPase family AAA domain-containing protein 1-B n=1 Tax=Thelohanellus kitauei TaxID=669202 RepID=A0A0C2NGM5_THEKT|nr:ATPase family AAA domain-containing protein 1-B [Thelohanellus kitauei]
MHPNTKPDDLEGIKERLIERGVVIQIPTQRLSDVHGLNEMKDKFFTLFVLPLLEPEIYEGDFFLIEDIQVVRNILIKEPHNKGLGHFIRAFAGEYGFHLITLDGRRLMNRNYESLNKLSNDIKSLVVNLQPSILFVRNMCVLGLPITSWCGVQESVSSCFQTDAPSVYTIIACSHRRDVINTGCG